ncbi:hypothetical protein M0R89_02350 [Halorussus limi]|uniref:DUF7314 domain-containing protein n=1 Tax=Halorussus limi TaxID=2938695 RepID=A0A8U0HVF6_9EURY|nr:hypothetical protein [Halorussus limi]UPV74918.1 hypothetical protein M0R89_02350 [Halorussus limi]
MADEFIKGLGVATVGGLGSMVIAGWYNTPTFAARQEPQLLAPDPTNVGAYGQFALVLKDALFWFALVGVLVFWVIVPAVHQLRSS